MNCPGSPALIGDESSPPGDPAMKGTAAHRVVEVMVSTKRTEARKYLGKWVHVPEGDGEARIVDSENAIVKKPGWRAFPIDEDMVYGVQIMVDEVERVKATLFMPEVFTERYLDMSWLDPRLGGTADISLIEPLGHGHLFDYKNGYVVVEVKGNPQMKQYCVGLLHEHPDIEGITVHLVQPNAQHEDGIIREITYTCDEIKLFEIEMKRAADATSAPNAPRRAGDWCMWCPAKTRCPEFDALAQEQAGMDFRDDPYEAISGVTGGIIAGVDNATLAQKARWIPLFDQWAREIKGEMFSRMMNGQEMPGHKLVQTKKHRQWIESNDNVAKALANFIDADALYIPPELKSPAQVEKLGDSKEARKSVKKLVGGLAAAPPGDVVVALANDTRDEVDPTTATGADFADDPMGDDSGGLLS
jgi:hypothetical protein